MADLLALEGVRSGYGNAVVVNNVSLSLGEGEALAVLGRNGMGKTTLLNTIIGVTRHMGGILRLDGRDITRLGPEARARAGVGWVPQERNIFRSLTVEENLTAVARPGAWTVSRVYGLFPLLAERRRNLGNQLSGGEQQMLAVARALVLNPRVILLDEPMEGLAPIIVEELMRVLALIVRAEKVAAIIVEQHAQQIFGMTDRAVIMERGSIAHSAPSAELAQDQATLDKYLGVAAGNDTAARIE
ncbi:MAG: ABC transporter ATP-binding protein [Rhodomicrobiaceae bacterium]